VTLHLLVFAAIRDHLGTPTCRLDVPTATVRGVKSALTDRYPDLAPLIAAAKLAIDERFAEDDESIPPGATLALIPPVSGG
jgi:molybdopterin synthase catalytic subunit